MNTTTLTEYCMQSEGNTLGEKQTKVNFQTCQEGVDAVR